MAAVGMNDDHTLAIYDIEATIAAAAEPTSKANGLEAFGKLTKEEVFDMRFAPGDW